MKRGSRKSGLEARSTKRRQVAVIGAGPSGLAAARCLLAEGYTPIVYERSGSIGGIWRFDDAAQDGGGPAYLSLRTNTPKQLTAFSELPFDERLPDLPSRAAVVDYLRRYATRFGLLPHIRFNTSVRHIVQVEAGDWAIHVDSPSDRAVETVDAVFVCSGMFDEQHVPPVAGLDSFPGDVLHSRAYRDAEPFAGRRVLVVGTGSSGVDIAADLGHAAERVWLSGRNDAWKAPTPAAPARPPWRERLVRHLRLRLGGQPHEPGDAPFVPHKDRMKPSEALDRGIAAGKVVPAPGIERVDGRAVHFVDGSCAEVDAVILATGYVLRFPFLDESIVSAAPEGLAMYRAVAHPERPGLFLIGMSRASGPIFPLAEMQARWAAHVLGGAIRLPPAAAMRAAIERRRTHVARVGGNPYRLQYEPYMDLLASEIGALPRLWRRPSLWRPLLAGPFLAARFRLDGPGSSRDAAAILRGGRPGERTRAAKRPPTTE